MKTSLKKKNSENSIREINIFNLKVKNISFNSVIIVSTVLRVYWHEKYKYQILKIYFFPPPQPHNPFTKPVKPGFCFDFGVSNLCSRDGNSAKLKAKSKNKGLQGTGLISGGILKTFGFLVRRAGSSLYSSKRSING